MIGFRFHQLTLAGVNFILLPKLNLRQMSALAERLRRLGFRVGTDEFLTARKGEVVIKVAPAGLCWSNRDPTDAIAPEIPLLLSLEKETVPAEEFAELYFKSKESRGGLTLRFSTRLEHGGWWKALRARDECGLTPDEHAILVRFLSGSPSRCRLLTDFPVEDSQVIRIGRRQFYHSVLDPETAASTLRTVGVRHERNSYLPRDGILRFGEARLPLSHDLAAVFGNLGGWCYLTPGSRESSNC